MGIVLPSRSFPVSNRLTFFGLFFSFGVILPPLLSPAMFELCTSWNSFVGSVWGDFGLVFGGLSFGGLFFGGLVLLVSFCTIEEVFFNGLVFVFRLLLIRFSFFLFSLVRGLDAMDSSENKNESKSRSIFIVGLNLIVSSSK